MVRSALRSLSLLLCDPAAFFEDHDSAATLPIAAILVIGLAVALGLSTLAVGSMLAESMDATVMMDNPNRPPEWVCEQHSSDMMADNCDEPAKIERDAGTLVSEAVTDYLGHVVIMPFILWALGSVVLFGAARLAGGTPSVGGTIALAGWAALPEFFRLGVGLLALRLALADVTITNPERGVAVLESALAPVEPFIAVATVLTVLWQWYLLTGGLEREANLSRGAAATAVGVPLGLWLGMALI
ncbi:YIP1 family protein [Natrinema sp. SYSU A 869]|uniref:YIP1 family protein n=1 Tax=Natrinema sp. SYSU A 869 TaxID=2871694 RepID=UPI001CA448F0|nr:YIP1 family protein [Natrinema sp. SYSU A 869]